MRCCQIQHNYKCLNIYANFTQGIFHFTGILVWFFFLDKIWKLLAYHTPSYPLLLQSYQLSKTVRFFWPTLYIDNTTVA